MKTKTLFSSLAGASFLAMASVSQAVVIDFTGGSVVNGSASSYQENGFQIDVIGSGAFFGDYYGVGNDVIHAHWALGGLDSVTEIVVTKIGGGTFDLNYFILTSNTDTGGSTASGTELAFIKNNTGDDIQLVSEDWGFPASQMFLPASYNGITSFSFYVTNDVDCFGMDEFYIDEAPPVDPPGGGENSVPEAGSSFAMMLLGLAGLGAFKKRFAA